MTVRGSRDEGGRRGDSADMRECTLLDQSALFAPTSECAVLHTCRPCLSTMPCGL